MVALQVGGMLMHVLGDWMPLTMNMMLNLVVSVFKLHHLLRILNSLSCIVILIYNLFLIEK